MTDGRRRPTLAARRAILTRPVSALVIIELAVCSTETLSAAHQHVLLPSPQAQPHALLQAARAATEAENSMYLIIVAKITV